MKKIIVILAVLMAFGSTAQNTFPNNGNVGINTATPSARLDVNGNMKIDSCLLVKDSMRVERDVRVEGDLRVQGESYFTQKAYFSDQIAATGKIKTDGNIKVGNNANIDNKLNVDGNATFADVVKMSGLQGLNNLNNPNLEVVFRTPNGNLKTFGAGQFAAFVASQPIQPYACLGGNVPNPYWLSGLNKLYTECDFIRVGIGTNDPQHKLHVVGTAHAKDLLIGPSDANGDALINGYAENDTQDLLRMGNKVGNAVEQVRLRLTAEGQMLLTNIGSQPSLTINNTGGGQALVIYNSNGTANSDKILQLEDDGMLRAREMRIDAAAWSDFVFEEEYELMSLTEVAAFIEKNKHLPNVPSEQEVLDNGINVVEMQALHMQKIEELTLYMIEMDQKMNEMEKRLNEMEAENKELKNTSK